MWYEVNEVVDVLFEDVIKEVLYIMFFFYYEVQINLMYIF